MAFTGIMCTEAEIDQKSGASVSASYTDTMKTQAVLMAENTINIVAKFNFSDVWAGTLNVDVKSFLSDMVSAKVAAEAIAYDMSGYTGTEARDKINILDDIWKNGLSILRQKTYTDFINGA